jgi:hypothetical protein
MGDITVILYFGKVLIPVERIYGFEATFYSPLERTTYIILNPV